MSWAGAASGVEPNDSEAGSNVGADGSNVGTAGSNAGGS